ncbi:MAG: hypothetical protein JWP63_801 [Candidatus Solibacter sp.]|nr:hypothetical protein [Candidatus Solibacter sp.]
MVLAILRALAASVRRDLNTYGALKTNNFFLFVALLIWGAVVSGVEPVSAYPFLLLLAVLMLFPISSDPLDKVPPTRLSLWPLTRAQRVTLRLASLAFSPILWLTVVLLSFRASVLLAVGFVAIAVAVQAITAVTRGPAWNVARVVPRFPGRIGGLVSANLREMLSLLDPYLAFVIALGGTAWRIFANADPGAFPILAMLAAVAMSTYAQCLFALESGAGMTRYRLLPLRGWQILLAKDISFLGLLTLLTLPLDAPAGLAFGLAALAIGRYPSMKVHLPQRRWRFSSGRVLFGVLQGFVGVTLAFHATSGGFLIALVLYAAALYLGGRAWDAPVSRSVATKVPLTNTLQSEPRA